MTPKRGELDGLKFDARGRLVVPDAIMSIYDAVQELSRDYRTLKGLPCRQTPPQSCPTQQVALPDTQAAQDAAVGKAVRWTAGKAWTALPHVYRTLIVAVGGATVGGISWPGIKAAILSILARL